MSRIDEIEERINAGDTFIINPDGTVRNATITELDRLLSEPEPMPSKPILCLDFDGVLNSYTSGWRGANFIPDPPVPGAMAFLVEAVQSFSVCIFSSRSHQEGGISAMIAWLDYWLDKEYGWDKGADVVAQANAVRNSVTYPLEKPAAMVTIDDRAITFTGTWPTIEALKAFKPWNK